MATKTVLTVPPGEQDKILRQKFYESVAAQSDLVDKLSGQLLTLELAVPGLYATVVKLVGGDKATLSINAAFFVTFGAWLVALALTVLALLPQKWTVDAGVLKQDPARLSEALGIEDFFRRSADYKRRLVMASSIFFFVGTVSAALNLG